MAFIEELTGRVITTLVLLQMCLNFPTTVTSLDCGGKAFHCENTTHFKICVDYGYGVSNTVEDFMIPCPPGTECHGHNNFECEFLPSTTPAVMHSSTDAQSKDERILPTSTWEIVTPNFPADGSKNQEISEKYLITEQYSFDNISATTVTPDDITVIPTTSAPMTTPTKTSISNSAIIIETINESVRNQSVIEKEIDLVTIKTDSVTTTIREVNTLKESSGGLSTTSYSEQTTTETITEMPKENISEVTFSTTNEVRTDPSSLYPGTTSKTVVMDITDSGITTTESQTIEFQSSYYSNDNIRTHGWDVTSDNLMTTDTTVRNDVSSNSYLNQRTTAQWKDSENMSADNRDSTVSTIDSQTVTDTNKAQTDVPNIKNIFVIIVPDEFETIGLNINKNITLNEAIDYENKNEAENSFFETNSTQKDDAAKNMSNIISANHFLYTLPSDTSSDHVGWAPSSFESSTAIPDEIRSTTINPADIVGTYSIISNELFEKTQNITIAIEDTKPYTPFLPLVNFVENENVTSHIFLEDDEVLKITAKPLMSDNINTTTDISKQNSNLSSENDNYLLILRMLTNPTTKTLEELTPTTESVTISVGGTNNDFGMNYFVNTATQPQFETTVSTLSDQKVEVSDGFTQETLKTTDIHDIVQIKENSNADATKPYVQTNNYVYSFPNVVTEVVMNLAPTKEPEYKYNDIDYSMSSVNNSTVIDSELLTVHNLVDKFNGETKKPWNEFNIGLNEQFLLSGSSGQAIISDNLKQDTVGVIDSSKQLKLFNVNDATLITTPATDFQSTNIELTLDSSDDMKQVQIATAVTDTSFTNNVRNVDTLKIQNNKESEIFKVAVNSNLPSEANQNITFHAPKNYKTSEIKNIEISTMHEREIYHIITKMIPTIPANIYSFQAQAQKNTSTITNDNVYSKTTEQIHSSDEINSTIKTNDSGYDDIVIVQTDNVIMSNNNQTIQPDNIASFIVPKIVTGNIESNVYKIKTSNENTTANHVSYTESTEKTYVNSNVSKIFNLTDIFPKAINVNFENKSKVENTNSATRASVTTGNVNFTETNKKTMDSIAKLLLFINETRESISKAVINFDTVVNEKSRALNVGINFDLDGKSTYFIPQMIPNRTELYPLIQNTTSDKNNELRSQGELFMYTTASPTTLPQEISSSDTELKPLITPSSTIVTIADYIYTPATKITSDSTKVLKNKLNTANATPLPIVNTTVTISTENNETIASIAKLNTCIDTKNDSHSMISEISNKNKTNIKRNIATSIVKNDITSKSTSSNFIHCSNLTTGRYPDNSDCRKFYICVDKLAIVGYCPINTVFSAIKKQCTKNLHHCIRNSEFQCTAPGRFRDLMQQNVYYICVQRGVSFIRYKYQCQTGFILDVSTVKCTPNGESLNINHSVLSSDTASNTKSSLSIEQRKSNESENSETEDISERRSVSEEPRNKILEESLARGSIRRKEASHSNSKAQEHSEHMESKRKSKCTEEGKIAHPSDCRKYYICYKNKKSELRRKKKKCDSDEVFDSDKQKCVDADSYECQL